MMELSKSDITSYLNKLHITRDKVIINTEKNNVNKCQDDIIEEMHSLFIDNCNYLLNFLETYKYAYDLVMNIKLESPKEQQISNKDKFYCKEFEKIGKRFVDDLKPFYTKERYLLCDKVFGKYYLVLTNDIIFIGKSVDNGKYRLKHFMNNNIVYMSNKKKKLEITTMKGIKYELSGDTEDINTFYDNFQEIKNNSDNENKNEELNFDIELIKYYLFIEDIPSLSKYLDKIGYRDSVIFDDNMKFIIYPKDIIDSNHSNKNDTINLEDNIKESDNIINRIGNSIKFCKQKDKNEFITNIMEILDNYEFVDMKELKLIFKIFDGREIFEKLTIKRFREYIGKINNAQRVNGIIKDAFDCLEQFVERLMETADYVNISHTRIVLVIEKLIILLFELIARRIFNTEHEKNIMAIKKRLKFKNFDYEYLIDILIDKKRKFISKFVDQAKRAIKNKLDEIFY